MTFYFYDLETSGFNPRTNRVMQFAGQRTDMKLKPLGEPDNILIKLTDDILPEPDAVLIHGITPQKTKAEGRSETEVLKYLTNQVFTPDTIVVGYNNVRFDDDFMRFMFWRNFTDAYEWQWKEGRSRWDILDVVRMTRALRPEGIVWPFAPDGSPSNKLADISTINKLEHDTVHDALSDVKALIAVARLIYNKQTKLFNYLLNLRDKRKIATLVGKGQPVLYTSGRYPSEYERTTVAVILAPDPGKNAAIMYDLRVDPDDFTKLDPSGLAELWRLRGKDTPYFPVKVLSYNRSPAVAPLSVLDDKSAKRLKIDGATINTNLAKLKKAKDFGDKLARALAMLYPKTQPGMVVDVQKVDEQLYDGFVNSADKIKMSVVRATDTAEMANLSLDFTDPRLNALLPLYKARNFPSNLSQREKTAWEKFRVQRLLGGGQDSPSARYILRLEELN